ncbi:MAG: YitT family protein [Bacteroidales bacterium]|jgi:uncharacterized membrane-anchored protein YitT (DUF2179 family)|nr:YitT family protein [Bacteroidales bacterium]
MEKQSIQRNIFTVVKNYIFIGFGLALFAFGWSAFLIPNELMGGGVSGVATLIYFATKTIPIGVSTLIINLLLVAIGYKILGRKFATTTIICTVLLSAFFSIMQNLFPKPLVEDDVFLCSLIGAMLSGVGVGIALHCGGNTGGTDIIVLIVNKYRNISYGRLSLFINVMIIGCSYLIVQKIDCLVYSYVSMIAYTFTSDLVIDGYRQTFQIMIFSSKTKEIAERINQDMHRGATLIKGYGAYTKQDMDILLVIAHRSDRLNITRIVKQIDSNAFVSIAKTTTVFGKNFDTLRL